VPTGGRRLAEATRLKKIWASDFVRERTKHGGNIKLLTVMDEGRREEWGSV
jgi:hypothetical protein